MFYVHCIPALSELWFESYSFFLLFIHSLFFWPTHSISLLPFLSSVCLPWLSMGCRKWFLSFHFRPQIISVGLIGVTPPDPAVCSQTLVAYSVSHAGSACASCVRCGLSSLMERETAGCTPHCHYHILHLATRSLQTEIYRKWCLNISG